jgi:hypothetical protein
MVVTATRPAGHDWPLTGRAAELSLIQAALSDGAAAGVVLAGDPWVGKTRLAREALLRARETGWDGDWVAGTRSAAAVPFGAIWHLLPDGPPSGERPLQSLRRTVERLAERAAWRRIVLGIDDADLLDDRSDSPDFPPTDPC